VSRIFAPESAAAAFRLSALVDALVRAGADVDVLTVTAPGGPDRVRPHVRVRRRPVLRDRAGYVRGYLQYMSFDLPLVLRLAFLRRPDVVVAEPPPTTGAVVRMVCAVRRIPYMYYAADIWSDAAASTGAPPVVVRLLRAIESWVLRGAARVIAVSPELAERARELGARQLDVVRNGIDTAIFTPDGPPPTECPSGPYAVYAGTASEWQGADVFVRAMAQVRAVVPEARLVFIGQGSGWSDLADAARALPDGGECVELLPPVPAAEAAAWQRAAAVALVSLRPGIGYDFAVPTKILAAAACGTPVVFAGPAGPAQELITMNRIGTAVAHDPDEVAAALVSALGSPPDSGTRCALARWAMQNASAAAAADRVAAVAGRVARRRAAAGSV
jgi:glycosyltransferase involved in cell wall biosynthesis